MSDHAVRPFASDEADAVIDRAVREMMGVEPRPGFRHRVMTRIGDEPRTAWSWTRLGLAAGAVAMVVLLAMWSRTDRALDPPMTAPQQAASEPRPTPSTPSRPSTPTVSASSKVDPPAIARQERRAPAPPATPPPSTDRRVSAASVTGEDDALEPGAAATRSPIDAIAIAPLDVRPLETPEIIVRPMPVGPLVIVPVLRPR